MDIVIVTANSNKFNNVNSLFSDNTCYKLEVQETWQLFNHFGVGRLINEYKYLWKLKNAENVYGYPCISYNNLSEGLENGFLTKLTKDIANLDFNGEFTKNCTIHFVIHDKDIGIEMNDHCLTNDEEKNYLFKKNQNLENILNGLDFYVYVFQHNGGVLSRIVSHFNGEEYEDNPKKYILKQIKRCL